MTGCVRPLVGWLSDCVRALVGWLVSCVRPLVGWLSGCVRALVGWLVSCVRPLVGYLSGRVRGLAVWSLLTPTPTLTTGGFVFQGSEGVDLALSPKSRRSLDIFAVVNGISKLSQTIM